MADQTTRLIKERLDIADVIRQYIQLTPSGINFKARCPFHDEKTPSFYVSPERQSWHCFGCNLGGDVFSFLMRIEGYEFPEALKILADRAGVELRKYDKTLATKRTEELDVLVLAKKFFVAALSEKRASEAQQYIKERKISAEAMKTFGLGFAPTSWDALTIFLSRSRANPERAIEAGLIAKRTDGNSGYYDRFRGRLMFPLEDAQKRVVGFAGRILPTCDDGKAGKYINSPETDVYHKSKFLYGLPYAKEEMRKAGFAIVVEGYLDAIAVWEAGNKNVLAVSGTAVTHEHMKIIHRLVPTVVFALDADEAGVTAMLRAAEIAFAAGLEVETVTLPFGKDPDECIRKDVAHWHQALTERRKLLERLFAAYCTQQQLASAEGKKQAADMMVPLVMAIADEVVQQHWLGELSKVLNVGVDALKRRRVKSAMQSPVAAKSSIEYVQEQTQLEQILQHLLAIVVREPLLMAQMEGLSTDFWPEDYQALYKALASTYNMRDHNAARERVQALLTEEQQTLLAEIGLIADKTFADQRQTFLEHELAVSAGRLQKAANNKKRHQLAAEIAQAEALNDRATAERLTRALNELRDQ